MDLADLSSYKDLSLSYFGSFTDMFSYTPEEFASSFEWLKNILEDYLMQLRQSDEVVTYLNAGELEEQSDLNLTEDRPGMQAVKKSIEQYLKYSVKTAHPRFMNQLFSNGLLPSLLGEVVTSVLNTSMATYEIAPMASLMEKKLVEHMSDLIGYENGEGIMLTGGSNANMVSLLAARNTFFPDSKQIGNPQNLVAFCANEAHYSYDKAMNMLGLGMDRLIKVECDESGALVAHDLEKNIIEAKDRGFKPFYVGATAGTTVKGAMDSFEEISKICQRHSLWFHIDGAWGGSLLLSSKSGELLKGSSLSDSFAWDPHKLMNVPLIASFIFMKNKGTLHFSHSGGGGNQYIFHDYENAAYDTGPESLQCGRRVDSLKVWLNWKFLGDKGYQKLMDHYLELAQYCENLISKSSRFELVYPVSSVNVCFQVVPVKKEIGRSQLNHKLRKNLVKEAKFLVNFSWRKNSYAEPEPFFRLIFNNPRTEKTDLDAFFKRLLELEEIL